MKYPAAIISFMKIPVLHGWDLTTAEARELQARLACRVIRRKTGIRPQTIGGIDVSVSRFSRLGRAAVVVLNYPSMKLVGVATAEAEIDFPYIPGLLSFREAPLVIKAFKKLNRKPDMIMVDGQGIAHPRRLGIASHLGLFLDIASIGCAKSRLTGTHDQLPPERGAYKPLIDGDEIIGAVLRTKLAINPLYISIGHKIDLDDSISYVLNCCRGFRLPEPTRLAHMAAGRTQEAKKLKG
ncbi:MAG: deoxyribonuclease V [Dehalococcoidia bacterium]